MNFHSILPFQLTIPQEVFFLFLLYILGRLVKNLYTERYVFRTQCLSSCSIIHTCFRFFMKFQEVFFCSLIFRQCTFKNAKKSTFRSFTNNLKDQHTRPRFFLSPSPDHPNTAPICPSLRFTFSSPI